MILGECRGGLVDAEVGADRVVGCVFVGGGSDGRNYGVVKHDGRELWSTGL